QGSTFGDTTAITREVIVNETFARGHWRESAVGHRIRVARTDSEPWLTIIGVVNDARTSGPTAESSAPMLYTPMTRIGGEPVVLLRTNGTAVSLAPAIDILRQMGVTHPSPPASVTQTMSRSIAGQRFVMV